MPALFIPLDDWLIHYVARQHNVKAEILQETRLLWCNTWGTWMPHTRTSQGWQCPCGELMKEETT